MALNQSAVCLSLRKPMLPWTGAALFEPLPSFGNFVAVSDYLGTPASVKLH
jgi:hypothetical protein